MTLADCMRSALLIYQKFVLLLIITLLLIKYDNADVDIKIENWKFALMKGKCNCNNERI